MSENTVKTILADKGINYTEEKKDRYRGHPGGKTTLIKSKDPSGIVETTERISHFENLNDIQHGLKCMPEIKAIFDGAFIREYCDGELLWEMQENRPNISVVRDQLKECLDELRGNDLVHGDIRPWNIILLDNQKALELKFIDWEYSFFVSDNIPDRIKSHLQSRSNIEEYNHSIDKKAIEKTISVLKKDLSPEKAWNMKGERSLEWHPDKPWE